MKKNSSIEEKPLKSIVDEIITKPLKKPKNNYLLENFKGFKGCLRCKIIT